MAYFVSRARRHLDLRRSSTRAHAYENPPSPQLMQMPAMKKARFINLSEGTERTGEGEFPNTVL